MYFFIVVDMMLICTQGKAKSVPGWRKLLVKDEDVDISTVRRCGELLIVAACRTSQDVILSKLQESGWMAKVASLLKWAKGIAEIMEQHSATILVGLEHGYDQTSQVQAYIRLIIIHPRDSLCLWCNCCLIRIIAPFADSRHSFKKNGSRLVTNLLSAMAPRPIHRRTSALLSSCSFLTRCTRC